MIGIDTPLGAAILLIGLAVVCIVMINILVLAKFSFARLSEEHLDDIEDLSEVAKAYLRNLYKRPARFINTAQFLILFFNRTPCRRWQCFDSTVYCRLGAIV